MKFDPADNVKMPTFVGIITFISRINIHVSKSCKAKKKFFQHFWVCEQMKFHAPLN